MSCYRETRPALIMAAPALIGLFLFLALPFLAALIFSFTNLRLGSPLGTEFVGLEQFQRILVDEAFHKAFLNNATFALVVVPLQTALALGLALLVNQQLKGVVVFRTLFFLPVVFPMALVAVVWQLIYAPGPEGMMNSFLEATTFGLWEPRDFLRDSALALPSIMLLSIWQGVGFQMIIMLAGLQNIPRDFYEAADIEGANPWKKFVHITLPQMRNTIIFVALVTTILAFRLFDQIQIMTQGGPHLATTTVMFEAVQSSFERQQIAKGSAMTVVFFMIVLFITFLQRRFLKQEAHV